MKASLKFRDQEKKRPIIKAKVPINILGLPFQSGLSGSDSKELCLSLSTLFDHGPSFRISYRPNDAFNPFSLTLKSGIGPLGSPVNAPLTMSAEFNLNLASSGNHGFAPAFFLRFSPQFGDFSVKKTHRSEIVSKSLKPEGEMTGVPLRRTVEEAVAGVEVGARTVLPIRNGAVLKMRWGVRVPEGLGLKTDGGGIAAISGLPRLVLNKISVEHVVTEEGKSKTKRGAEREGGVAEACLGLKKEVETLRVEKAGLGKAMEELRAEFATRGRRGGEIECGGGGVEEVSKKKG